jgi:hypothetical protein
MSLLCLSPNIPSSTAIWTQRQTAWIKLSCTVTIHYCPSTTFLQRWQHSSSWFRRCSVSYRHLVAAENFKCQQPRARAIFSMLHKSISRPSDKSPACTLVLPGVYLLLVKKTSPCIELVSSSPFWHLHYVVSLLYLLIMSFHQDIFFSGRLRQQVGCVSCLPHACYMHRPFPLDLIPRSIIEIKSFLQD